MTLWHLSENEQANIQDLARDLDPHYATRLRELGFSDGESVRCLKRTPFGGPKVYQICDGVFSLEEDIASKILITQEKK